MLLNCAFYAIAYMTCLVTKYQINYEDDNKCAKFLTNYMNLGAVEREYGHKRAAAAFIRATGRVPWANFHTLAF